MTQQWQRTGRVVVMGEWRGLLAAVFWLWGLIGFGGVSYETLGLLQARGMGSSVNGATAIFVAMEALWWIGGMVLLGLGALLAAPRLAIERPAEA
jgi:hypothetical protein